MNGYGVVTGFSTSTTTVREPGLCLAPAFLSATVIYTPENSRLGRILICAFRQVCANLTPVRAVALLGPVAKQHHVRQFELPGLNIFFGNELDATDEPDVALIFGGDGTIHRHLAALATKQVPLLVVPMGSANDFAASIGITSVEKSLTAWRRFCTNRDNLRAIDLGTIAPVGNSTQAYSSDFYERSQWKGESLESLHFVPSGPRRDLPQLGPRIMDSQLRRTAEAQRELSRITYFACIAGSGLDAAVNRLTLDQPRWLRGHGGYVVAMLQTVGSFRPPHVRLEIPVDNQWQTVVDEPGFLVAAGNGPQYGHGMRLTHRAQMDDGLLDVCFVRVLSKIRLLTLFRLVYRGRHIGLKEVEYFRAMRLRLHTNPITEVFSDGEYICRTPVEIGLRRDALRVIVSM